MRCHRRGSRSQHILGADTCRFHQRCPKAAADFPAKLLNTQDIGLQQQAPVLWLLQLDALSVNVVCACPRLGRELIAAAAAPR